MTQSIMNVTLDARQVRQACEEFVAERMQDDTLAYTATMSADATADVAVTKKRVRKGKNVSGVIPVPNPGGGA